MIETCVCQVLGYFYSGLPGVIARVVDGQILSRVERCDECERYPTDEQAETALRYKLGGLKVC